MGLIRVVRGTAHAPTEMASYDAALAAAGVHNYNLVTVSSVVPADARVERVGTAPDLGPVGERLTVVQGRATVAGGPAVAGLGWATGPDGGLFYEASGAERAAVRREIKAGLAAGKELREWSYTDGGLEVVGTDAGEGHATALVLAVYGESEPLC
jgi:arginine decarboxylase